MTRPAVVGVFGLLLPVLAACSGAGAPGGPPGPQVEKTAHQARALGPEPDAHTFFMQRGRLTDPTAVAHTATAATARLVATGACEGSGSVRIVVEVAGTTRWSGGLGCDGAAVVHDLGIVPGNRPVVLTARPWGAGDYYLRVQSVTVSQVGAGPATGRS